ncbi:MAG: amidohydrolase [Chloroflexi bacterium]|nr:amidohydrolase [Chloroflexota bacterium]
MKNGMLVADSDMHVMEPADLWQRYIDPAFKHAAPAGLSEMQRDMRVRVKSRVMLRLGRVRPAGNGRSSWRPQHDDAYAPSEARNWDAGSQVEAMDKEGLDLAVLFPSRGLFVLGVDVPQVAGEDGIEPEFAAAISKAYNDWMKDFAGEHAGRTFGAGMAPPHNVEAGVLETRRCVQELGFKAMFMTPWFVGRRGWHDSYYDPLWAEIARQNVPIAFHGGGKTYITPDYLDVLDKMTMWHTLAQPLGLMKVAVSLCAGGTLERHPNLRVSLLEGNCSWAPWLFHRLDEHYAWVGKNEIPELKMKPSEYFKRNCFLSVDADEDTAKLFVQWFGDDNLVFSTDYPHADSMYPHATDRFLKLDLSDTSKRKILWDNWCRLYNIPKDVLSKKTAAKSAR